MNNLLLDDKRWNTIIRQAKAYGGEFRPTPQYLVDQMLEASKIDWSNPNNKFLDPACGIGTFLRSCYIRLIQFHNHDHIIDNMLYGIEINKIKCMGLKQTGFKNISQQDFMQELPKEWPDKFDIIVGNPPYAKKMDLKFLNRSFDICKEEIVFVHPSTVFVERKKAVSIFKETREKIKKTISSITLFNGNGIFGIGLYVPCSITHISKTKENLFFSLNNLMDGSKLSLEPDDIENISIFGFSKIFLSLEKKIDPDKSLQSESIEDRENRELRNRCSFFVTTSTMQGACKRGDLGKVPTESPMYNDDFFTVIRKFATVENLGTPRYSIWWEFDTREKAENFIKYCKTDFARFSIALTKMDQAISGGGMKKVPWMDFSQEWTDEKLYEYFNITEEEQKFIKEIIPAYYD